MICRKCNNEKPASSFYENRRLKSGFESQCKQCKKEYVSNWRKQNPNYNYSKNKEYYEKGKRETGGYAVYYLPEEHRVGFTNNVRDRMWSHKRNGLVVEGYEVVGVYDCPIQAHLTETILHTMGYNGFQHKY